MFTCLREASRTKDAATHERSARVRRRHVKASDWTGVSRVESLARSLVRSLARLVPCGSCALTSPVARRSALPTLLEGARQRTSGQRPTYRPSPCTDRGHSKRPAERGELSGAPEGYAQTHISHLTASHFSRSRTNCVICISARDDLPASLPFFTLHA